MNDVRGAVWPDVENALRRGWKIFPVWGIRGAEGVRGECACPKAGACEAPGKHPAVARGFLSAVGQEDGGAFQAAAWWADGVEPRNIGIRTGSCSDLLVFDVDLRSGGAESYDMWEDVTGLEWPGGGRVWTGRDGWDAGSVGAAGHWYLRWAAEWLRLGRVVASKAGILPGIDVRGDGGYVLAPGSAHVSGGRYRWAPGWESGEELPHAEEKLLAYLRDIRKTRGRMGGKAGVGGGNAAVVEGYSFKEARAGDRISAGNRDAYFNDLAFRLRCAKFTWSRAEAEVRADWERTEQPVGQEYAWETALGKLERVWATVPAGGYPQEKTHTGEEERTGDSVEDHIADVLSAVGGEEDREILTGELVPSRFGGEENNDTGNGLRYVRLFAGKARYVREIGQWYLWDEEDCVWRMDKVGRAMEWTKQVVDDIRSEGELAGMSGNSEDSAKWYKWAHSTASMGKRETLLRSASVEEGIRTEADELDAGRWTLALRGGHTIDLKTGTARLSDPQDLITKCAGVSWADVEEARGRLERGFVGGLWEGHILRMVKGNTEAAAWLRRMAGYSLTGSVEEQVMSILHGNGENGKNVFMETLCSVWGGYAIKAQAGILTAGDEEHPVGIYGLKGARLVFVDEVGRARINETRLKDITGGAVLRARDIGQSWVEFEMKGKVWVNANSLPAIRDSSHGMWRRIRRVELHGKVGHDGWVRENGFAERLQKECAGEVMAWALEGLREWLATGLGTYEEMERLSAQYRDEEDMFGLFIRECLNVDPAFATTPPEGAEEGDWSNQRDLYRVYTQWCGASQDRRDKILNFSYFGRELRKALPGLRTSRGRADGERVQKVYGVSLKSRSMN